MDAEILHWQGITQGTSTPIDTTSGSWETYQDPITFEIRQRWVASALVEDNLSTPQNEFRPVTVPCLVRGITSGGTRVSENFAAEYANIDVLRMWVPADCEISLEDRVTNIRERAGGKVLWKERDNTTPTIFNVSSVVPLMDGFNRHTETLVVLERTPY